MAAPDGDMGAQPASAARVWLVLGVVAACLAIWGIEQLVGFPEDWAPARAPVQLR
jgi:type VI protein secretion system component VasK